MERALFSLGSMTVFIIVNNPLVFSSSPSLSPDVQHLQRLCPVSRCRVPVCLLRRWEHLPQVPHPVPVLQRLPVLLVRQLCDGPGPGHSVGGLRIILLGLQEARSYSRLPNLRLTRTRPKVRWWIQWFFFFFRYTLYKYSFTLTQCSRWYVIQSLLVRLLTPCKCWFSILPEIWKKFRFVWFSSIYDRWEGQ